MSSDTLFTWLSSAFFALLIVAGALFLTYFSILGYRELYPAQPNRVDILQTSNALYEIIVSATNR